MVAMTQKGRSPCFDKGSYLDWEKMHWTLHGKAKLVDVPVMEPCEEEPLFKVYYTKFTKMTDCMYHCQKVGGRAPTIVKMSQWQNLQLFMNRF